MEDIVITSAQVIFPDNKTLDEKIAEIMAQVAGLAAAATTSDDTSSE